MPKIEYVPKNFGTAALDIIAKANEIIAEYQNQGFKLTLRQLYYRFIAMDLFPESWIDPAYNAKNGLSPTTKNTEKSYKHLGTIINDARLAGLVDWDAIEDRTRNVRSLAHWNSPSDILSACASQYRIDKWATQKYRPHVWIEKDALLGVIEGVCNELDVPYFSCRGYTSQSEMWSAAMKIREEMDAGYTPILFHLGDHDPSGIDMTRDIKDRIELFMGGVELQRLALNQDQVEEYNPPPNPAKLTDSRCDAYIATFGSNSWELDSLEPQVLVDILRGAILSIRDDGAWEKAVKVENTDKKKMKAIADTWSKSSKKKGKK